MRIGLKDQSTHYEYVTQMIYTECAWQQLELETFLNTQNGDVHIAKTAFPPFAWHATQNSSSDEW